MIEKPKPKKNRGIRIGDEQWERIKAKAAQDKSGRTKPADVIRYAVDKLLDK